ncbi:2-oxoisovalerate dehydrogenase subunit alpha, mitochondrial-like [Dysidea avara]|uniref:2-oxoisovalerate dehydrogenase subunit alpha, mitochondrial-like n=1 Tax=Dysidea avara TaxID=196820 RepID=UPI00333116DD
MLTRGSLHGLTKAAKLVSAAFSGSAARLTRHQQQPPFTSYLNDASTPWKSGIMPAYRIMDSKGKILPEANVPDVGNNTLLKIYKTMIYLNTMDKILYEGQRQGRISFYLTHYGEEATVIASTAALEFEDTIYGQYREAGALLWRGFTVEQCVNQCYGNALDKGRGRQMPIHYGDKDLNFQTICSHVSVQVPQAPGYAYALKLQKKKNCVICYFGDGAAQMGDFHAALNFAATRKCPVIFVCRNNGYAISTPLVDQYAGDGIVTRGQGYGVESIRVDGNDALAVYDVTDYARKVCIEESRPILIEAMTYRVGHHTTSDDSTKYRTEEEVLWWKENNCPITRLQGLLIDKKIWSLEEEQQFLESAKEEIKKVFAEGESVLKPNPNWIFEDVYSSLPANLQKQKKQFWSHISKYQDEYPLKTYEHNKGDLQ